MGGIIIATAVIAVLGLGVGVALVQTEKRFHVEVDGRIAQVRELLPGNNCGACGYAGCDAVAAVIVSRDAPVYACPVCSNDAVAKIGAIMGVEAGPADKRVAFVRCSGTCDKTDIRANYIGISDCRAAELSGLSIAECAYGCLGLGSCARVCTAGAITIRQGVASVDPEKCVGCALCTKACPRGIIKMTPAGKQYAVACFSKDKGPAVKKVCVAGCIGCGICVKQCENGAITVVDNRARIDYGKCTGCGKCAAKCPSKVIKSFIKEKIQEAGAV